MSYFDSLIRKQTDISNEQPQTSYFDSLLAKGNQSSNVDITGLGEKQAVEFSNQLAKFGRATPAQQFQTFEQYGKQFQDYLNAKGYLPTQITREMEAFNQKTDPRNQTGWWEYYVGDRGNDIMAGFGNLIGDALAAVPESIPVVGGLADDAEKYTKGVVSDWQKDKSAKSQINTFLGDRKEAEAKANGAGELGALWENITENPMQVPSMITEQAPQLLLGALGKVALTATNALGGMGRVRSDVEEAYEKTAKENPNQLLSLPEIQTRMANGMSFEEAVADAKTDVTDNWKSILAGGAIGGLDAFTPLGKFAQGINRGFGKTLAKEVGTEIFQGGAEQLNSNLAVGQIDGKTKAMDKRIKVAHHFLSR